MVVASFTAARVLVMAARPSRFLRGLAQHLGFVLAVSSGMLAGSKEGPSPASVQLVRRLIPRLLCALPGCKKMFLAPLLMLLEGILRATVCRFWTS
jgi:hypothetical protein